MSMRKAMTVHVNKQPIQALVARIYTAQVFSPECDGVLSGVSCSPFSLVELPHPVDFSKYMSKAGIEITLFAVVQCFFFQNPLNLAEVSNSLLDCENPAELCN